MKIRGTYPNSSDFHTFASAENSHDRDRARAWKTRLESETSGRTLCWPVTRPTGCVFAGDKCRGHGPASLPLATCQYTTVESVTPAALLSQDSALTSNQNGSLYFCFKYTAENTFYSKTAQLYCCCERFKTYVEGVVGCIYSTFTVVCSFRPNHPRQMLGLVHSF